MLGRIYLTWVHHHCPFSMGVHGCWSEAMRFWIIYYFFFFWTSLWQRKLKMWKQIASIDYIHPLKYLLYSWSCMHSIFIHRSIRMEYECLGSNHIMNSIFGCVYLFRSFVNFNGKNKSQRTSPIWFEWFQITLQFRFCSVVAFYCCFFLVWPIFR